MLIKLLIAFTLMAACITLHAIALTAAMRWLGRRLSPATQTFRRELWLLILVAGWTVLAHLAEILVWACFYTWKQGMPDLASAVYFSAVTYTTVGYGDLVLPPDWRMVGGVEALTGILMCGWSTGFFFATVSRMFRLGAAEERPRRGEGEP